MNPPFNPTPADAAQLKVRAAIYAAKGEHELAAICIVESANYLTVIEAKRRAVAGEVLGY